MVSEAHPKGDKGGNDFIIAHYGKDSPYYANSLHYLWDHLLDQTTEIKVGNPMNQIEWSALSKFSQDRVKMFPYESLVEEITKNTTVQSWAGESKQIAETYTYKNVEEMKDLTEQYMKGGIEIINKRLALAGYRLADLVIKIYQDFIKNSD